jgi:hypothetical protein
LIGLLSSFYRVPNDAARSDSSATARGHPPAPAYRPHGHRGTVTRAARGTTRAGTHCGTGTDR